MGVKQEAVSKKEIFDKLISILNKKKYTGHEVARVIDAYHFADDHHKGQKRASGEEYIIHPVSVALYLAEMNVDTEMIVTGLLHDVVEDTEITLEEISERYGENVAVLVNGVTKITQLKSNSSKNVIKAETIRKMLFTMIKDMRVIVIKLADKVHNMSTLQFLPVEKQRRIAKETLEIYAPLAGKLGLSVIKHELENYALRILYPVVFHEIDDYLVETEKEKSDIITDVEKKIKSKLGKHQINFEIKSRVKHHYSIYKKMKKYNKNISDIFDLYGIRIITDSIVECYTVFGIIHQLWQPVPGRFKDYIANPKSNGYMSLHTTVVVGKRKLMEIQIRTKKMHERNEYGIAAHWYYKTGEKTNHEKLTWLDNLKAVQEQKLDSQEYYNFIRNDILKEEIFVFTPKGDIKELPKGATPLDFAYLIHTEVGHRCKGARANGNIISLHSPLKNGMVVEVITGKESTPKREWMSIVKTTSAKKKIRNYFSTLDEKSQSILKKQIKPDEPEKEAKSETKKSGIQYERTFKNNKTDDSRISISVEGDDNFLFNFAKCCKPKPPNEIIGFISRGRGIIIHRKDCKNIQYINEFDERKIPVEWSSKMKNNIYSFFIRTSPSDDGYMEISNVIKKHKGHIIEFQLDKSTESENQIDGYFSVELPRRKNIDIVFKEISNLHSVFFIDRR